MSKHILLEISGAPPKTEENNFKDSLFIWINVAQTPQPGASIIKIFSKKMNLFSVYVEQKYVHLSFLTDIFNVLFLIGV